jgi:hypothetical protein
MPDTKPSCVELASGLLPRAEKELAAYARAVLELFGSDEAIQSIEDWMKDLEWTDWPSRDAIPDWRRVTIAAAMRLASRVQPAQLKQMDESICQDV